MRRLLKQFLITIVLPCFFVFYSGCGKDNGGEAKVGFTGSLNSTDYTVAGLSIFDKIWESIFAKSVFATGTTVDKVWALPLYNGEFHPSSFAYAKEATVTTSGFSLELEKRNWILILLNSTAATRAAQVVGYVTMTVGSSGLQNIPLGDATGDVNVGTLSRNGTETTSSRTSEDNATTLSLTADQLLAIAKSDDTLKVIKNSYRNYTGTYYTTVKPFFAWSKSSIGSSINNTFSTPSSTVANDFKGYLFYMNSNDLSTVNFSRLCAGTDTMTLVPPSSVTNSNSTKTFTSGDPLSSAYGTGSGQSGTSCGVGKNLYIRDDSASYSSIQFNFSANHINDSSNGYLAPPIVSGDWTLKINGSSIATFEGDLGNPFEGSDTTKPIVPIPAIKANVSGSTITSVEVKWYQRAIGGSTYSEVTDSSVLNQLSSVMIALTNYSTSPRQEEYGSNLSPGNYSFTPSTYTWSTSSGVAISVSYTLYGVAYHLDWRY